MDTLDWQQLIRALQNLLDYLGFDLFRLPLPANRGVLPCPRSKHIQRKSIIRRIGAACKFIEVKPMHLQPHLIGGYDSFNCTLNGANKFPNMGDIRWIMEDQQLSFIRQRSDLVNVKEAKQLDGTFSRHCTRESIFSDMDDFTCSTPDVTTSRSLGATGNVSAMDKISALEEELCKLREMLANMATVGRPPDVIPHAPTTCILPPAPPTLAPPPPPPPPPPPSTIQTKASSRSVADIISERRKRNGESRPGEHPSEATVGRVPSMTDVLKGLGSIKLKSISRSPGGTPLPKHSQRPLPDRSLMDPQAIIAAALKRKFAHLNRCSSPDAKVNLNRGNAEEDKENSYQSSCDNSECGQHLLKPRQLIGSPLASLSSP